MWGPSSGEADREFWRTESRYVSMGGETCSVSEYCDCTDGVADMEEYHWSYLNSAYHPGVIARWRQEGCLGRSNGGWDTGSFSRRDVSRGGPLPAGSSSSGWNCATRGSPRRSTPVRRSLVLTDASGRKRQVFDMPWDPRRWFAGEDAYADGRVRRAAAVRRGRRLHVVVVAARCGRTPGRKSVFQHPAGQRRDMGCGERIQPPAGFRTRIESML